jgi:hypothetical protein
MTHSRRLGVIADPLAIEGKRIETPLSVANPHATQTKLSLSQSAAVGSWHSCSFN